ncbi:unnamed protein product [Ostreobium quekettii]|uniref:Aminotransferase class I/classII large domain-containing protein n=1 Tax=Ostreobium quekettii TaxID=121088 RepID=A0A8S1IY98_9CHLO|nr:unnamed protein product [Ostreobium quekettii]
MWERTLTVNGFSKAYSMTGWRLGYLAAPPQFAAAANKIQSQTTSAPSSISQHAGLAALALGPHGGKPVKSMVEAFRQRRDFVVAALDAMPGVRIHAPDGAFYVFPDVSSLIGPDVVAEGFGAVPDGDALCKYLVEHAQVAAVPGSAFGQPDCIRLSYAASMDVLKEGLSRVARALDPSVLRHHNQS